MTKRQKKQTCEKGTRSREKQLHSSCTTLVRRLQPLEDLPMSIVSSKLRTDPSPGMRNSLAVEVIEVAIQGIGDEGEVLVWLSYALSRLPPAPFPRETVDPYHTMQRLPRALCGSLRSV